MFAIFVVDGPKWVIRGEVRPWNHDWRHATREAATAALKAAWKHVDVKYEVREV